MTVNGSDLINLASFNFLSMIEKAEVQVRVLLRHFPGLNVNGDLS